MTLGIDFWLGLVVGFVLTFLLLILSLGSVDEKD